MLKEIKINKIINMGDKDYFVLSIYFIDTRILLEMVTEREDNIDLNNIPQTLEEQLIRQFNARKNGSGRRFELVVNNSIYCSIGGSEGNFNEKYTRIRARLPKEFEGKRLNFIKYEFEPIEEDIDIKEIFLVNIIDSREYIIEEKYTVPFDLSSKPFEFMYKDKDSNKESSIIIKELFYEDIEEDRRVLFNCKDNEKMLWGLISADSDIRAIEIFTEKTLKGGINYTHAPMMPIYKEKNSEDKKLIDHKMFLGFTEPGQKEVDIILYSIRKKADISYEALLLKK